MDETIGFTFKATDKTGGVVKRLRAELEGVGVALKTITKRARIADNTFVRFFRKASRGAAQLTQSLTTVSIAIMGANHTMTRMVDVVVGGFVRVATAGIEAAANVEESNLRLDFSLAKIGKNADVAKAKIDQLSLRTVLTRREITDMVSTLAIQKIDVFDASMNNLFVTMGDGSKSAISAMEVLNDAVAFSGKNVRRVMFSVKEAVSEQKIRPGRLLADDLNLSRKELVIWNKTLMEANDNQDAFNKLMQMMATRVGGSTAAIGSSLNFVLKQVSDWIDKLGDMLFRDALPSITEFVREAGDMFLSMVDKDSFAPIRAAIGTTMEGLGQLAKVILIIVRGIVGLFEQIPALVPLIAVLGVGAVAMAGFLLVMTAVLGPMLAFAGLAALLPVLLSAWIPILGIMLLVVPLMILAAAPLIAMVALMGSLLGMSIKAKNFTEFWEKLKLVISGVVEGVKNLSDGTTKFSAESAAAMEKAGVLDTVIQIVTWFDRLVVIIESAKKALKGMWPEFREALFPILGAVAQLAETLGIDLTKGLDTTMTVAERRGQALADVIKIVVMGSIRLLTIMLQVAEKMAAFLGIDTTQNLVGSPEAFNALSQQRREQAINQGLVPVNVQLEGRFGKMHDAILLKKLGEVGDKDFAATPGLRDIVKFTEDERARRLFTRGEIVNSLASLFPTALDQQKPTTSKEVTNAATSGTPRPTEQNATFPKEIDLSNKTIDLMARKYAQESNKLMRSEPLETSMDPDAMASGVDRAVGTSFDSGN